MELSIKGLLFFFLFIFKASSYVFSPCLIINVKLLLTICGFGGGQGKENGYSDLRNTAMVLAAFWEVLAKLEKSKVLYDHVSFEWSVVLFEFTVLTLTPPPCSSLASYQLGILLCSQTFLSVLCILKFIDFCDLEKMLTKSTEGWEDITVWEEMWPKSLCTISRIIIANPQVPDVGLSLRSCCTATKPYVM